MVIVDCTSILLQQISLYLRVQVRQIVHIFKVFNITIFDFKYLELMGFMIYDLIETLTKYFIRIINKLICA